MTPEELQKAINRLNPKTPAVDFTKIVKGLHIVPKAAPAAHAHDPRAYENYWKMRMEREAREAKAKGTTNG